MLLTAFILWWYGHGWAQQLGLIRSMLVRTFDFFSVDLLARTLFSPFRQISAGKVRGSLEVQFRAWLDRLISRFIGALLRTVIILVGLLSLITMLVVAVLRILFWPLLPLLPVIFVVLMLAGWIPWRI
jgi:hypothetical protein